MADIFIVPSKAWFPQSLAARMAWWANFAARWPTFSSGLGLDTYNGQVDKDNGDFQSIGATRIAAENFRAAIIEFMRDLCEAAVGSPKPVFPTVSFSAPPNGVDAGIYQRLIELRDLIMAQPTYTKTIGEALGIEPSTPEAPSPGSVKAGLVCHAAMHGYEFTAVVSNRQQADQAKIFMRQAGTDKWLLGASPTGKSIDISFDPGEATGAIVVEVYAQFLLHDEEYGIPSDIVLVTVNP